MGMVVKECGELLKRMEEKREEAKRRPEEERAICAAMLADYQEVMLKMEKFFLAQDIRKYLQVRRARAAASKELEEIVPFDILYLWLVENVCNLEAE